MKEYRFFELRFCLTGASEWEIKETYLSEYIP